MEPDTVPYDADEVAWQGWQVPAAPACSEQQVSDDAIPPTLCYDTFMADPGMSGFEPAAEPPGPSSEVDAAATLAYEADPGGFPQPYGAPSGQPSAGAFAEAATQQYGDTLVLEHEGDTQEADLSPEVDASPAPVAVTAPAPAPAPLATPAPAVPAPAVPAPAVPAPVPPAEPASPPAAPEAEPAVAAPAVSPPKVSPRKSPVASPKATTNAVSSPRQAASASPRASPTPAVPAASSKVPHLQRLWGKQPPPPAYVALGPPKRKSAPARMARPAASTLPAVAGCRVRVKGDGWGGGIGQYEATVVDGDELSFTVIYIGENKKHQETHVMREFCTLLEPPIMEEPKNTRRRTC